MRIMIRMMYERLRKHFGEQNWWPADTTLEMMVGAILVQNTNWRNVEKALTNLSPFLTPEQLDTMNTDELAALIRPSGYYNIKAKRIKSFLQWFKTYHYDVEYMKQLDREVLRRELLKVKGIGRETADVMLLYVMDKPVFVADAYSRRIFYRIGWDIPSSYDVMRQQVEEELGKDLYVYQELHALLVEHAKALCRVDPICSKCPLLDVCDQRFRVY